MLHNEDISVLVDAIGEELSEVQSLLGICTHPAIASYMGQWNSHVTCIAEEIHQFGEDLDVESDFYLECPTGHINIHTVNVDTQYALVGMINQLRVAFNTLDEQLAQLAIYCPSETERIDTWRHCLDQIWCCYANQLELELDSALGEYERLC